MKKVLFVCTGNTCRSPMAEAIFNRLTWEDGKYYAESCGIYGDGVSPVSDNAKTALSEIGIMFNHISTPLTEECMKNSVYIVGITANHARMIVERYPEYADKVFSMPKDIPDPYGGDIDVYRKCRDEIQECVKTLIKSLQGEKNA